MSWTPDDRIVYVSNESGSADIWVTDMGGNNRKQLTANSATNVSPVVTADGRYIVFASWQDGRRNLWRMNFDGSNPMRLTSGLCRLISGSFAGQPLGYLHGMTGAKPTLWKVSIDGGTPVQITDHVATVGAVSPDGRWIAYTYPESPDPFAPPNRLAVMPFEGGPNVKTFEDASKRHCFIVIHWSHDGKSILYSVTANNVTNIWSQPLEGGPPKQVTDFKEMLMTGFAWSRDGK